MNLTPEEIKANRKNPEKLLHIVGLLTEAIELDERKRQNMFKLRWELRRQMHLNMPVFWLGELKEITLQKTFMAMLKEYEIVFGKRHQLARDAPWRSAADWQANERMKYEEAQKKVVAT